MGLSEDRLQVLGGGYLETQPQGASVQELYTYTTNHRFKSEGE